jgi:hypothetical protein
MEFAAAAKLPVRIKHCYRGMRGMTKATVYGKPMGGAPVPMKVRVEWKADGLISPTLYWTPDGTCYQVKPGCKSVQLAYLKDRAVGLRFEVRSKVIHTPHPYPELHYALCEAYLFLEDGRVCEKNFLDARYQNPKKSYITVEIDFHPNGEYDLAYFRHQDERYKIEAVSEIDHHGAFLAGGVGIRHKVSVRKVNPHDDDDPDPDNPDVRVTAIYWERDKWFISLKAA